MADSADPLAELFTKGMELITNALPGWQLPNLLPPGALPFDDCLDLRDKVCVGDHIAVMNPSGYWHHGIYVQPAGSSMVIDVWGETKGASRVTRRSFREFVSGGTRFALIQYAEGTALAHEHSAALALHLHGAAGAAGFYNIAFNNCEHFATLCRTLRCEQAQAVARCLQALPTHVPRVMQVARGFK
jgi:hypothetical protein